MTWFKVDDGFHSHEKVKLIPRPLRAEAIGTWTLCGTWSAEKERDGFVPEHMIDELSGTTAGAEALVEVKLWKRRRDGYQFVNWKEFQFTREQNDERREAERVRKAAQRAAAKAKQEAASSENVPVGQKPGPTHPVPSRSRTPKETITASSADKLRALSTGPTDDSHQPVDKYQRALTRASELLNVDKLTAGLAVDWILARAKGDVMDPSRYVARSINAEPFLWEQFATEGKLPA